MAVDMFFKIGDIKGESKDGTHGEEIDVLAWSWGMSQSGTTHLGTGSGAGKVNVQDISFTKWIDKSSAPLMQACAQGTHIPTAKLTVRKAGDKPLEYYIVHLADVHVASVSTGGSGGEDRLTENVTLNFGQVKIEYFAQDATGVGQQAGTFKWNIPSNTDASAAGA